MIQFRSNLIHLLQMNTYKDGKKGHADFQSRTLTGRFNLQQIETDTYGARIFTANLNLIKKWSTWGTNFTQS